MFYREWTQKIAESLKLQLNDELIKIYNKAKKDNGLDHRLSDA